MCDMCQLKQIQKTALLGNYENILERTEINSTGQCVDMAPLPS